MRVLGDCLDRPSMINKPHDSSYKLLFSEPELIIDLLKGFVDQDWVNDLDFKTLEKVSGSFITDDLRSREDDIIWRVRYRQNWVYVYLLIEFQSTVDPFMAVRLMTYIGLLYQDLIKTRQLTDNKHLPPIFPVVLYNGERRWTADTELKNLITPISGDLEQYLPSLKFLLLDEGAYRNEQLQPLKNLVAAIFRLENAETVDDVLTVVTNLIEWLQRPEQSRTRRHFTLWIKKVLLASSPKYPVGAEINDLLEIKTMLAKRLPVWLKESQAQGEAKGEARGKAQGEVIGEIKGKKQILLKQLTLKFGALPNRIVEKINASEINQLDKGLERVLTAVTLDDVFKA